MADLSPEQQQQYFGTTFTNESVQRDVERYQKDPLAALWDLITGKNTVGKMSAAQGGTVAPTRSPNEAAALTGSMQLVGDIRNAQELGDIFRTGAAAGPRQTPYDAAIADQARAAQMALMAQMRAQAQGPSLAAMQGQQALAQGGQQALRAAAMGQPGRASMLGMAQAGAGMGADVARARLAEQMRAQAGIGGLASGVRGADLQTAEAQARAALQQRQQDDALRQFYAQMGGTLQNAREQAAINRQITYNQLLARANARDVQTVQNFMNQAAPIVGMAVTGGPK